jgi:putative ABC transport system permease protein
VLLTPPPYSEPERLVLIQSARASGEKMTGPQECAAAHWMEWQKEAKSFESIAAYNWSFNFLILPEGSESLEGMFVTREYFSAVGLQPILGRTFLESESGSKPAPVIVLGYDLWQRRFNGDRNIIGKKIQISRLDPLEALRYE